MKVVLISVGMRFITSAFVRSLGLVDEFTASAYVFLSDEGMEGNADGRTLAPH
jgi:hypothetical protein